MRRRDFLKGTAAASGIVAAAGCRSAVGPADYRGVSDTPDRDLVALAEVALRVAEEAGASYADCRIADYRRQRISTRERRVQPRVWTQAAPDVNDWNPSHWPGGGRRCRIVRSGLSE